LPDAHLKIFAYFCLDPVSTGLVPDPAPVNLNPGFMTDMLEQIFFYFFVYSQDRERALSNFDSSFILYHAQHKPRTRNTRFVLKRKIQ
jgi:hypothetical protein